MVTMPSLYFQIVSTPYLTNFRNLPFYDTAKINKSIDYTQVSAGEVG